MGACEVRVLTSWIGLVGGGCEFCDGAERDDVCVQGGGWIHVVYFVFRGGACW